MVTAGEPKVQQSRAAAAEALERFTARVQAAILVRPSEAGGDTEYCVSYVSVGSPLDAREAVHAGRCRRQHALSAGRRAMKQTPRSLEGTLAQQA